MRKMTNKLLYALIPFVLGACSEKAKLSDKIKSNSPVVFIDNEKASQSKPKARVKPEEAHEHICAYNDGMNLFYCIDRHSASKHIGIEGKCDTDPSNIANWKKTSEGIMYKGELMIPETYFRHLREGTMP